MVNNHCCAVPVAPQGYRAAAKNRLKPNTPAHSTSVMMSIPAEASCQQHGSRTSLRHRQSQRRFKRPVKPDKSMNVYESKNKGKRLQVIETRPARQHRRKWGCYDTGIVVPPSHRRGIQFAGEPAGFAGARHDERGGSVKKSPVTRV